MKLFTLSLTYLFFAISTVGSFSSLSAAAVTETVDYVADPGATMYGPYVLEVLGPDGLIPGSVVIQVGSTTLTDTPVSETMGQLETEAFSGYIMYDSGVFSIWPSSPSTNAASLRITYQYDNGQETEGDEPPVDEPPVADSEPDTDSLPETDTSPEITQGRSGLPEGKQGQFPIQIPDYEGVDQLLMLSNQWVVVGNINLQQVAEEIARLTRLDPEWTDVDFLEAQKIWAQSVKDGNPNYYLKKRQVDAQIERYLGQARVNLQEQRLDEPITWSITSSDDSQYSNKEHPVQVSRYIISLGHEKLSGMDPHYAHYSYLQLPYPMKNGDTYTIRAYYSATLPNGQEKVFDRSVTFTYDEYSLVSRAIKANQVGYLPEAEKWAYVGAFIPGVGPWELPDNATFKIVNADTGNEVFTGPVTLRKDYTNPRYLPRGSQDPATRPFVSGENIYEIDFSAVKEPGVYFISVEGVGRSWPFLIDSNAYAEAFYVMARGMFHQRCGIELKQPYTFWPRIECHTDPVGESDYIPLYFYSVVRPENWYDFDIVGGTRDFSSPTEDATGGWHDAGDWDRRIKHYTNIFDLLSVYELKPNNFYDGQLNIPESGNGIPDVLDEAEYGLLVWKKSMTPDGGVAGRLETNTHPPIDDKEHPWAYSKRSRWSSLIFAAAAAQYAKLVEPFNTDKSVEYAELAKRAYAYGTDPNNSLGTITIYPKRNRGEGEAYAVTYTEEEQFNKPMLLAAKLRLFLLTGEESYIEGLQDLLLSLRTVYNFKDAKIRFLPTQWPFSMQDDSIWFYSPIFKPELQPHLTQEEIQFWKNHFIRIADDLTTKSEAEYYRRSKGLDEDHKNEWGFGTMTNVARELLFTHHLTGDEKYKQAALFNADYMLGANPQGMVWTSGIGYSYVVPIHHNVTLLDDIQDPVPGITIYGPNQGTFEKIFDRVYNIRYPDGREEHALNDSLYKGNKIVLPMTRNWIPHEKWNVKMNEFTITETMSSGIFVYGYLLDEDWSAPDWVQAEPRDKSLLFGWWYLP